MVGELLPAPCLENLVHLLLRCRQRKDPLHAKQLHAFIRQQHLETHRLFGNYLVSLLVDCVSVSDAQHVFDRLPQRNVYSWTSLISGYVESEDPHHALRLHRFMQNDLVLPNNYTFVALLKACARLGDAGQGRELHTQVICMGLERDRFIGNVLIDMYGKCAFLADARQVFDRLPARDGVSWTALIAGYAEHGIADEALSCFEQMQLEGVSPDDASCEWGFKTGTGVLQIRRGNSYIYVALLMACTSLENGEKGQQIHAQIIKRGLEQEPFVGNTLIDMYGKCGMLAEARHVFDKLRVRDHIPWNALTAAYTEHGHGEEALNCFKQMELAGIPPVAVTFVCSLRACGIIVALDMGQDLHTALIKRGLEKDQIVANTLVDMYCKCGALKDAHCVFEKLPFRDVITWNAMIKGSGENHEGNIAIRYFEDMQEEGVKPNAITFTCLLGACSHASLILQGQKYFKLMKEKHGIEPLMDHYACMVDLLSRSGKVHEAVRFIRGMKCLPSTEVVRTLVTACKIHGELEIGLRCFQDLAQGNQKDALLYLQIEDICSTIGKESYVTQIEDLRKHAGARKKLANASIEVNKKLHEFIVGDSRSIETSAVLETWSAELRNEGHILNLNVILTYERNGGYCSADFNIPQGLDCVENFDLYCTI